MSVMSHTQLAWRAAGMPRHGFDCQVYSAVCATCGAKSDENVLISDIETPTTAGHADLFRFGGSFVCGACAWLFAAGKGRPGNFIVYGDQFEYTVISLESVVADKRPWLRVLRDLAELSPTTPVTGVMTTDVKPRLWHRARLATIGRFGLYVHAPDYDVSEWRCFDLARCLEAVEVITRALALGYAKASCYHGLLRDYARASKDPASALELDAALAAHRDAAHFLPALIAAGVTKEEKMKHEQRKRAARDTVAASTGRDTAGQAQPGLF